MLVWIQQQKIRNDPKICCSFAEAGVQLNLRGESLIRIRLRVQSIQGVLNATEDLAEIFFAAYGKAQ